MPTRISSDQLQRFALNVILDRQAALSRTQRQVASGQRLLSPADDPAAAAQALDLRQVLETTQQYQSNITAARSRLTLVEDSLSGVENILRRVRELAIQANNDTQTNATRGDIAAEVRQRLNELLAQANTRDANNEYIFAGFQSQTQPFVANNSGGFDYNGDDGQRFLQVGPSRQVPVGDSGTTVFREIREGNGTFAVIDNPANTGSGIADPGTVRDSTAYDRDTYTVILAEQTPVTGGPIGLNDTGADDTLQYVLEINGENILTLGEGATQTVVQIAAAINTQSTTVTAYVDGGTLYLANSAPNGQAIEITERLNGASEDTDTVTGYFGAQLTGVTNAAVTTTVDAPASSYVVVDSGGNVDAAGAYQAGAAISFSGIETNITGAPDNGDRFTVRPSNNRDMFSIVLDLSNALEAGVSGAVTGAEFHNAINRVLADLSQAETAVLDARARGGARLNAVDSQGELNEAFVLQVQENLSDIEDLDFAEAVSRLNLQLTGLEAAQQAFVRIQGLSLFDLL